jgi:hypothetical protein
VESLFRISGPTPKDTPVSPRPENKRVRASLLKGKDAVIQEVGDETERRDPSASKTRVKTLHRRGRLVDLRDAFARLLHHEFRIDRRALNLKTAVEARAIRQFAVRQAAVRKAIVTGTVKCEAVDLRNRSLTFAAVMRSFY